MNETTFKNKCFILADLWMNYRDEEAFKDFVAYSDLGLPIAYALDNALVSATEATASIIDETFSLLLAGLEIIDEGYESLDDVFSQIPPEE